MFKKILITLVALSATGIVSAQNWDGTYWFTITFATLPPGQIVPAALKNDINPNYLTQAPNCNNVVCSFAVNPNAQVSAPPYQFYVTVGTADWQKYCQIVYEIGIQNPGQQPYIEVSSASNCKGLQYTAPKKVDNIHSNVVIGN